MSVPYFIIGNIGNIPVGDYLQNWESQSSEKIPKIADNVIVFVSNILEAERLFSMETIENNKSIRFAIDNEKVNKYIQFQKLFVVLRNNTPPALVLEHTGSNALIVQALEYNNSWDIVFQRILKNAYIKPWYLKLWEAIPVWSPLK